MARLQVRTIRSAVLVTLIGSAPAGCSEEPPDIAASAAPAAHAKLQLQARALSAHQVEFVIHTDLPLPVEVMASVNLASQEATDTYVGHTDRIRLEAPSTTFVLDTSKAQNPLPEGEYAAEVAFYSRWGAENGNPAAKAAPDLSAVHPVTLTGSGQSRASAERRNELQSWVMSTVELNEPWDEARFRAKLGSAEKSAATLSPLHDAYYYPDADMTLIVNRVRDQVSIWRMGRATK